MESLKGIFPLIHPPPKRDFVKENVQKIRTTQVRKVRRPSNQQQTEYSKFNKQKKQRFHNSMTSLSSQPNNVIKGPPTLTMNNLRKSMSQMSIQSREFGVQTTDPDDEYFLKDSIIRYPSASTVRSIRPASSTHQLTCSKGHQLDRPQTPQQQHRQPQRKLSEKMDRHLSNLSEFLDQGSIAKKSILKTSKNRLNESQQRFRRSVDSFEKNDNDDDEGEEEVIEFVDLTAVNGDGDGDEDVKKDKIMEKSLKKKKTRMTAEESKRQEAMKLAEADPECPAGHVPLLENERLEALKLAKNRFKELIDDLNRLPMTCETLRVRNRKIEIEKELRTLEINIRVFSRPKVYVKLD